MSLDVESVNAHAANLRCVCVCVCVHWLSIKEGDAHVSKGSLRDRATRWYSYTFLSPSSTLKGRMGMYKNSLKPQVCFPSAGGVQTQPTLWSADTCMTKADSEWPCTIPITNTSITASPGRRVSEDIHRLQNTYLHGCISWLWSHPITQACNLSATSQVLTLHSTTRTNKPPLKNSSRLWSNMTPMTSMCHSHNRQPVAAHIRIMFLPNVMNLLN